MIFNKINIAGPRVVDLNQLGDERAFFARAWCEKEFGEQAITAGLNQANLSFSHG